MVRKIDRLKLSLFTIALSLFFLRSVASADDPIVEDPVYNNNTGALNSGSNLDDISMGGQSGDVTGTKDGEVTIRQTDSGVEVYSGLNKVEVIPTGSDGWVGSITINGGEIKFHPAGRPELDCPAQSIANWFGPCKIAEEQS